MIHLVPGFELTSLSPPLTTALRLLPLNYILAIEKKQFDQKNLSFVLSEERCFKPKC